MLLTVDVGNTDTCFGAWAGEKLTHLWRAESATRRTADEYAVLLGELFRGAGFGFTDVEDVVIGSVVPAVTRMLRWMTEKYTGRPALVISGDSDHGLPMEVESSAEVGADRVVNCIAALAHHRPPLTVIDFGTATTFDVVDKSGVFRGGLIVPGIRTGLEALAARAARLASVEVHEPRTVVGASTVRAMASGVYWGEVARVEGILARIEEEQGAKMTVLATGGLAPLVAQGSRRIQEVREDLTVEGLRLVWKRMRGLASPAKPPKRKRR